MQSLQGESLLIDRSALPGEALPVSRKPNDAGCAGTIVRQGEMPARRMLHSRNTV